MASTISINFNVVIKCDVSAMWRLLEIWEQGSFIFYSSTDIYGKLKEIPADEEHPPAPTHWYGLCKLTCEQQGRLIFDSRKPGDLVVFRAPFIIGPHYLFPLSPIGKLINRALNGDDFVLSEQMLLKDWGTSWVNAREFSRWIVTSLNSGYAGIYNATNGFCSWRELIKKILSLSKGKGRLVFDEEGDNPLRLFHKKRLFLNEKLKEKSRIDYLIIPHYEKNFIY